MNKAQRNTYNNDQNYKRTLRDLRQTASKGVGLNTAIRENEVGFDQDKKIKIVVIKLSRQRTGK